MTHHGAAHEIVRSVRSFVRAVALFPAPTPPAPPTPMPAVKPLVGGPQNPDGTEIQDDLPTRLQVKNRGGSDGAGLLRFGESRHAGRWQNVPPIDGIFEWMRTKPGGGWPEKVDAMIAQLSKEKGIAKPDYLQVEGDDFELLRTACKTGRMPAVTYGYSPTGRYGRAHIAHMVNLMHADEKWCRGARQQLSGNDRVDEPRRVPARLGRDRTAGAGR